MRGTDGDIPGVWMDPWMDPEVSKEAVFGMDAVVMGGKFAVVIRWEVICDAGMECVEWAMFCWERIF